MEYPEFEEYVKTKHNLMAFCGYYKGLDEIARLKCSVHNIIMQKGSDVVKYGCLKCKVCIHGTGICSLCEGTCKDFEDYKQLNKQIHGLRFKIKDAGDNVEVFCHNHGWIIKSKFSHLREGCHNCKDNKEHWIFMNKMIDLYGFKFDYSECKYVNESTKVILYTNKRHELAPKYLTCGNAKV